MRMNSRLAVLLTVLVMSAVAFSQSTLGNMFQLGSSTTVSLPTSSSTITGALIYDSTVGAPKYNTGTAWKTIADTSATSGYFYDAGLIGYPTAYTGGIAVNEAIVSGDGGIAVVFGTYANDIREVVAIHNEMTGFSGEGYLGFHFTGPFDKTNPRAALYASNTTSGGQVAGFNIHSFGPVTFSFNAIGTTATRVQTITGSSIDSYFPNYSHVTAATRAFNSDTGALWDPGGGTNDYFTSDGTGITTPSYWKSTATASSTPGVQAARVTASGTIEDDFTAGAATAGAAGTMALNTTTAQMTYQPTATTFAPLGQPHVTYGAQTFSTRIASVSGSTTVFPQLAERVSADATATLQMAWPATGTGASSGIVTTSRTLYVVVTGTEATSHTQGYMTTSSTTPTMKPTISISLQPRWCQWISAPATITAMRVWAGLTSAVQTTGSTMQGSGTMFRYDTTVDGLLYLCNRDGTTQTCTSTGITVAASTQYHLCLTVDSSRISRAWVNGTTVTKLATNAPLANTELSPFVSVEQTGGTARALGIGVMQVESL